MAKRPLPTGEEPPKGYESLLEVKSSTDEKHINCVFISQLAAIELSEINAMRQLAFSNVKNLTGLTNTFVSFEHEVNLLPGKEMTDKLLFRAYKGNTLIGYALVVIGWPDRGEWVIQHLVINPNFRLQGVGSSIVSKIEDFALRSEVDSDRIFAIPLEEKGAIFWQGIGYKVESSRQFIKIEDLDHELIVYRKEL